MIEEMEIKFNNFFRGSHGQRQYPYWFFYILPTITISRTSSKTLFCVHLGFLWFNLTFIKKKNK